MEEGFAVLNTVNHLINKAFPATGSAGLSS